MTTIITKNGSGAPTAGQLSEGELAVDLTNKELYTKSGSTVIKIGSQGGSSGTFTDLVATDSFTSPGIDDNATSTQITVTDTDVDFSGNIDVTGTATLPDADVTTLDVTGTTTLADVDVVDLDVTGSFTSPGIDDNATSTAITIDANENVGIGTTSPFGPLDVKAATDIHVGIADSGSDALIYASTDAGQTAVVPLSFQGNSFKFNGSSEFMRIDASGKVGIGTSDPNRTLTVSSASGVPAELISSSTNSLLAFFDANTGVRPSLGSDGSDLVFNANGERMRIDSSGNVGIGTDAPAQLLSVGDSDVVSNNYIRMNQRTPTAATTYGGLEFFYDNTAGITGVNAAIRYASGAARNDGELTFYTGSSGSTSEAMRIDASGNVGIGYSSPTAKLHVLEDGSPCTLRVQALGASNTAALNLLGRDPSNGSVAYYIQTETDGALSFSKDTTERMRIDSSGTLFVGKTSLSYGTDGLHVQQSGAIGGSRTDGPPVVWNRNGSNGDLVLYRRNNNTVGIVYCTTTATTYGTSSDVRLKRNIVDAPAGNIDDIKIRSFAWKIDGSQQKYGVVAQELFEVAPEAVTKGETEEDTWGVDYSKLVPMMIKEIQDLKAEVAALKGA